MGSSSHQLPSPPGIRQIWSGQLQAQAAEGSCPLQCCTPCQGSPRQPHHRFPFWHSSMFTCFWACLVELSPRNHSRKKCLRKAGTACCRTSRLHRAGAFHTPEVLALVPVLVFLSATRSSTESQAPVCRDTSQKPEDLDTSSLHLCACMKGHFIPNTLCYQAQTPELPQK